MTIDLITIDQMTIDLMTNYSSAAPESPKMSIVSPS